MPSRNVDTARRRRTVFGLELHHLASATVIIITVAPAVARWVRRTVVAVLASGTLTAAGRMLWELGQG